MTEREALGPDNASAVEQVVAGLPQSIGSFHFWFADQRWEWSTEVAAIYGYRAGGVQPSTELLLSHKHPDDREQVARSITTAIETGEPFCGRHRVIDTSGAVHYVIVVADRMLDEQGTVVGTTGYCVDLTDTIEQNRRDVLDDTVRELMETRGVIEQAKGMSPSA